jgi:hypothetical protein
MDASETDDESIVGDVCHIVAREPDGPRGTSPLTSDERDKYSNFILLCKIHHKIVDDQLDLYTVERLHELRANHERWVRESLDEFDSARQRDDEVYAGYVEEWSRRAHADSWHEWGSFILSSGQPSIPTAIHNDLKGLRRWLLSRVWPERYPELEAAFENFRRVLQDFQETFAAHSEDMWGDGRMLITKKFYTIPVGDPPLYDKLVRRFDFHVALVEDLMLELTRAGNYICDKVRQFIHPTYRIDEGVLLVESGPYMDMTIRTHRLEYRDDERILYPYPGLERFKTERSSRDIHFGVGVNAEDPKFLESLQQWPFDAG